MRIMVLSPRRQIVATAAAEPRLWHRDQLELADDAPLVQVSADEEQLWATELSDDEARALGTLLSPQQLDAQWQRHGHRAVALMAFRRGWHFDPLSGAPVQFNAEGTVARVIASDPSSAGREIYPRIDPAVICRVDNGATEPHLQELLLARRAGRAGYYSLVAGYIDAGETAEAAVAREVWEETGRRVGAVRYWGSQPWSSSGSLMLGFCASSSDREPVGPTDGELAEIRWVSRRQLEQLSLPAPGSIAYQMIMEWYRHG